MEEGTVRAGLRHAMLIPHVHQPAIMRDDDGLQCPVHCHAPSLRCGRAHARAGPKARKHVRAHAVVAVMARALLKERIHRALPGTLVATVGGSALVLFGAGMPYQPT